MLCSKVEKQLDSTAEWMLSMDEIDSQCVSKPTQSFDFEVEWLASTSDPHFVEKLASTSDPHFESMNASFSFGSTGKCNSMVDYLPQRAEILTLRSNLTLPATGEEYC